MNKNTPTYSSNLDNLEPIDATTSAQHGSAAGVGPAHPCVIGWPVPMLDTGAAESLRAFAVAHNEMAFAHLMTAALNGETWAIRRVYPIIARASELRSTCGDLDVSDTWTLELIHFADTTRPDGAAPRSFTP